jgi:hypothetical protein
MFFTLNFCITAVPALFKKNVPLRLLIAGCNEKIF